MDYTKGKSYRAATGEVLYVAELNQEEAIMRVVVGANGKIPEEELYVSGPSENFQDFMTKIGCVEVSDDN